MTKSELSASIQRGLVESGKMRAGAAVMLCLSLSKVDCSAASHCHLELFWVRSKSGGHALRSP